jgi:hypothetical protein
MMSARVDKRTRLAGAAGTFNVSRVVQIKTITERSSEFIRSEFVLFSLRTDFKPSASDAMIISK